MLVAIANALLTFLETSVRYFMTTQRWTDEMVDDLAKSIQSLRDTVLSHDRQFEALRDTVLSHDQQFESLRDTALAHDRQFESLRDTVLAHDRQNEGRDQQMDLMAIGINRLLEDSREYKQWKVENDQRFNILLAEVRAMNRRVEVLENQ